MCVIKNEELSCYELERIRVSRSLTNYTEGKRQCGKKHTHTNWKSCTASVGSWGLNWPNGSNNSPSTWDPILTAAGPGWIASCISTARSSGSIGSPAQQIASRPVPTRSFTVLNRNSFQLLQSRCTYCARLSDATTTGLAKVLVYSKIWRNRWSCNDSDLLLWRHITGLRQVSTVDCKSSTAEFFLLSLFRSLFICSFLL